MRGCSFVVPVLAFGLLFLGCSDSGSSVPEQSAVPEIEVEPDEAEDLSAPEASTHCYRNEGASADELLLIVEDDDVSGSYRGAGEINGMLEEEGVIVADYSYTREGQPATDAIVITIEDTRAVVQGSSPERGLDAVLAKVDCP